ncbi:hypothetical protein KUCAC02_007983 [Chaenocephalus aceratus]|uniref:Uncharacterized protein n=1 Tax=Chaenocephalus aceratus TaxID=36190 RepID=A0ACB9X942_CHAAC|nr:hypothetical protein KUCAC02_007983 [Chaenocephalus aceratus]
MLAPRGREPGTGACQCTSWEFPQVNLIGEEIIVRDIGSYADGKPARPFVLRFLRFQQKEAALRWSRNHEVNFRGSPLRFYPDLSSALAKKRADYNGVKQALYKKGVRFRLMHPVRQVVTFEAQTFTFDSPEDAQEFYKRRVAKE